MCACDRAAEGDFPTPSDRDIGDISFRVSETEYSPAFMDLHKEPIYFAWLAIFSWSEAAETLPTSLCPVKVVKVGVTFWRGELILPKDLEE